MKRIFDIVASFIGLCFLLPLFLVLAILIVVESRGGVFYKQIRVGKNFKEFGLYKFRSMHLDSDKVGQLTVGMRDPRITKIGYYIRKYKLDELPQLINVLLGDMSLVGPRPEVPKYVAMYNEEQRRVLLVQPGITDFASLEYFEENKILAQAENPEKEYIEKVMPAKLALNLKYIAQRGLKTDLRIIFDTIKKILS